MTNPISELPTITHILYVTGRDNPGAEAFAFEPEVMNGMKARLPLTVVGNPKDGCSLKDIEQAVATLPPTGRTLIVLRAHGTVKGFGGNHWIQLTKDEAPDTEQLLKTIAGASHNKPIDIMLESCRGNSAQFHKDLLPAGSTLISASSNRVYGAVLERSLLTIPQNSPVTAETLMDAYLTSGKQQYWELDEHNRPIFCVSGGMNCDLRGNLEQKTGKPFSKEEVERAHQKLDGFFKDEGQTVGKLIGAIQAGGRCEDDKTLRRFMAVVFAASPETPTCDFYPVHLAPDKPDRSSFGQHSGSNYGRSV